MKIAITGSTGLVGKALCEDLDKQGHSPIRIVRDKSKLSHNSIYWLPAKGELDSEQLEGMDAVVHLAGAGIGNRRWSKKYKRILWDSRVDSSKLLTGAIAKLDNPPNVYLQASGMSYYGNGVSEVDITENSPKGKGFLSDLTQAWEEAGSAAAEAGVRTCFLRSGLILSASGGTLKKILPLFKMGVGGKLGNGKQYMSWIGIDDVVKAISHIISDESLQGPINFTTPNPVTNVEFTKELGKALGRPTFLPAPAFGVKTILGKEMAEELVLGGNKILPKKLQSAGYDFEQATLKQCFQAILD